MKNKITALAIALFSIANVNAQERIISENQLPKKIQSYIKKHFSNESIVKIEEERKFNYTSYDVDLSSVKLEFKNTEIKEIDSYGKLPNSVIPASIRKYVASRYPQNYIISWKITNNGRQQEVELNNEIELLFDRKGNFIRMDN